MSISAGNQRLLDLKPTELHERIPIFIGSAGLVKKVQEQLV